MKACVVCGDPAVPNKAGLPLCDAVTCWRLHRFGTFTKR